MKYFLVVLMLAVVCHGFEDKCREKGLKKVFDKCRDAKGVTDADVMDLVNKRPAASDKAKCFRACLFEECKYLNPDGKFNDDVPIRLAWIQHGGDESRISSIESTAKKCVGETEYSSDVCATINSFIYCMHTKNNVPLDFYRVFD